MTLTQCATMSWSSRATRWRSSPAARSARARCSWCRRSACAASSPAKALCRATSSPSVQGSTANRSQEPAALREPGAAGARGDDAQRPQRDREQRGRRSPRVRRGSVPRSRVEGERDGEGLEGQPRVAGHELVRRDRCERDERGRHGQTPSPGDGARAGDGERDRERRERGSPEQRDVDDGAGREHEGDGEVGERPASTRASCARAVATTVTSATLPPASPPDHPPAGRTASAWRRRPAIGIGPGATSNRPRCRRRREHALAAWARPDPPAQRPATERSDRHVDRNR